MHRSTPPGSDPTNQLYSAVYHKRVDNRPVVSAAELVCAWIERGRLSFSNNEDRCQAFSSGVFLLHIPSELDVTAPDQFAREFFRGDASSYGGFRKLTAEHFDDELLGFHQRADQVEQFLLERRFWISHYPTEIIVVGEQMITLSQQILCAALEYACIPASVWSDATGSCSHGAGAYHLTFNYYQMLKSGVGLSSHKDDGFITILRTTQPGLEINRDDCWERVSAAQNMFVINFGLSMEWLTFRCEFPVAAIMHRVSQQSTERTSFGHFSSSNFISRDQGIYSYCSALGLERVCDSRSLIDKNDREIYQGTHCSEGGRDEIF